MYIVSLYTYVPHTEGLKEVLNLFSIRINSNLKTHFTCTGVLVPLITNLFMGKYEEDYVYHNNLIPPYSSILKCTDDGLGEKHCLPLLKLEELCFLFTLFSTATMGHLLPGC